MADILQDFPIAVPPARVYQAVSTPAGLDTWWTKRSAGEPVAGRSYELHFGDGYDWRAVVTQARGPELFELRLTRSDRDWDNTLVGFELEGASGGTQVRFYHRGWPETNEHYRISCHCWALYLRVLRRHLEFGESVPYEQRLLV